jgi:hypothetical protein
MFFVLGNTFFGSLQVHGPASFPFMLFAWETIKDVSSVPVLQAANLIPIKFDGIKNFRGTAFILKFLGLEHNKVELVYKA